MRKKIIVGIFILILIIIFIAVYFTTRKEEVNSVLNQDKMIEEGKKITEKINNTIMKDVSSSTLSNLVGTQINNYDILIGSDSFLSQKVNSKMLKKYNLDDYEKAQNIYVKKVEQKIKDGFEYEILNTSVSIDGDTVVEIKFKSYYYANYLEDLLYMIESIYNYLPKEGNEEPEIALYQAKVKAMEILDNYLDNYDNKNNYLTTSIVYYENINGSSADSIYSYLINVKGTAYPHFNEYNQNKKERVTDYINKAVQNGTFDKNNPLKLRN